MAESHSHPGGFICLGWYKNKYHLAYKFEYKSVYPELLLHVAIRTRETDSNPVHASFSLTRDKWSTITEINAVDSDKQLQEAVEDNQKPAARYLMGKFKEKIDQLLKKYKDGILKDHERVPG